MFVVIITGICIAVAPDWEIRHANTPAGNGLKLTGIPAVVVGIGVVIWGIVFLLVVIYPDSRIWSRRLFSQGSARGSSTEPADSRCHGPDEGEA